MFMPINTLRTLFLSAVALLLIASVTHAAEEKKAQQAPEKKGPPPAIVVLGEAVAGQAEPMAEFVGTVYYAHISDIASEVSGKVVSVVYDEGQRVKKGQTLVVLGNDLLRTTAAGTRATFEQSVIELERAHKDLTRMEALYKAESISESLYDEHVFRTQSLDKKALALEASLRNLEIRLERATIRASFAGIAVERSVEPGEWVREGGKVAVIANDSKVDVIIDVPESTLSYLKPGRSIEVKSSGKTIKGKFTGFIPKGDVATRTFSIKVRFKNKLGLIEGMEAKVMLPVGQRFDGILVSRDAVINKFGRDVVFASVNGAAKMIPVKVLGYQGMSASISGQSLKAGMKVVVKGNERIMDGQPLRTASGASK